MGDTVGKMAPGFGKLELDDRLATIARVEVVQAGVAPTAVLGWARRSAAGWELALGAAGDGAADAIFDLASLTKPLTALVAARGVAGGLLRFQSSVGALLPALARSPASAASLEDLLAHRAGLPSHGALYRNDPFARAPGPIASIPLREDEPHDLATMLARAASRVDERPIGRDAEELYSDVGYVLAGAMIAAGLGTELAAEWEATCGATSAARYRRREPSFGARVIPTEVVPWRGGTIRGEVHDENAFVLERASGHPGHAGAFGTVAEVAQLGMRFIDALDGLDEALLPRELAERMIAPRDGGTHRIGWDTVTKGASSSGRHFGPRAFGHLGFTGTSLWADPDAHVVAVMLTNRVHPTRENDRIRQARPRVHDLLWSL